MKEFHLIIFFIHCLEIRFNYYQRLNQKIEDKYSELKTYCEEEMERMEDLLRVTKSLNQKKTHIVKQIKNFKKEIIYFQSTTEDLKKQK